MSLGERFDRAAREIEAAQRARGLVERRCPNPDCDAVMGEYVPPIGLYRQKCRHCGLYSELTTESNGTS